MFSTFQMKSSHRTRNLKCGLLLSVLLMGQACFMSSVFGKVIFQADFNGEQSGTGGPNDLVTIGGSGTLYNYTTATAAVKNGAGSFGQGGYLSVSLPPEPAPSDGYLAGVQLMPAGAAHSWAALVDLNPNGFVRLQGGADWFLRVPSPGVGGFITDWTRILEVGSIEDGNLRLIVSAQYSNKLRVMLTNESSGLLSGDQYDSGVVNIWLDADLPGWNWSTDALYHFGIAFQTDANDVVTLKVFGNADGSEIATGSDQDLLGSASFKIDGSVVSAGMADGVFSFNIGGSSVNGDGAGRSVLADAFRLYDEVPAYYVDIPEPSIFALFAACIGFTAVAVRRIRR